MFVITGSEDGNSPALEKTPEELGRTLTKAKENTGWVRFENILEEVSPLPPGSLYQSREKLRRHDGDDARVRTGGTFSGVVMLDFSMADFPFPEECTGWNNETQALLRSSDQVP